MGPVLGVVLVAGGQAAPRADSTGWAGDPVNTLTGQFVYSHTDLRLRTPRGAILALTHSHASFDTRVTPLGPGWNYTYNQHLAPVDPNRPNDEGLVEPDGRTDVYRFEHTNPDGTWTYSTPRGIHDTLVRNADASYTSMRADHSRWDFKTGGGLERIVDPQGHETVLHYRFGAGPWPVEIGDESGSGVLHLEYNSCTPNRLCFISDWLDPPRVIRFEYDAQGRLTRVINRESAVTSYAYDGESQRLASITDALAHVALTNDYDARGRVTEQFDARGRVGAFTYSDTTSQGEHTSRVTVDLHAASGFAPESPLPVTDTCDDLGRVVRQETLAAPGESALAEERSYNDNWELIGCTRHGGATLPPAGEPAPADTPMPLLPSFPVASSSEAAAGRKCSGPAYAEPDWRAANDPRRPLLVQLGAALKGASDFSLDAVGRLESFAAAGEGSGLSTAERTWRLAHDREDRLIRVEQPNTLAQLSALVTQIDYDAVGNVVAINDASGNMGHYAYDERDALIRAEQPDGEVSTYSYDDRGDLTHIELQPADGSARQVADVAFDGLHRLRRIIAYPDWPDTAHRLVTEYGYDDLGQRFAAVTETL